VSLRSQSTKRQFQSILCAVDFSPQSTLVLQTAAEAALKSGGHLIALYVEDPVLGQGAAAAGYDMKVLRTSTLVHLQRLVARVAAQVGLSSRGWSVESIAGRPAASIVRFARSIAADLIVMGTNGRRGSAKLLLGSTAEGVLRRAPAPVMVVPGHRRKSGQRGFQGTLLGAIELGPKDVQIARRMAAVAQVLGMPISLVNVIPQGPGPAWLIPQLKNQDRSRVMASQQRMAVLARHVNGGGHVVRGRPCEGIQAVASRTKAGLIALALKRGHGLFAPRQGTTPYRVLCASRIRVLALPPGEAH
jgi:nucleotide-binding universal stress UspA family protein